MEIYVEYAILENVLVDGALLYLAQAAAGQKISFCRLLLAAALGAGFAVLFPFLEASPFITYALKFTVGALLCFIAVKTQNGRGRYALTILLFYALSFCFGGGVTAVFEVFGLPYGNASGGGIVSSVPIGGLLAALAFFVGGVKWGIKKLYAKKRVQAHVFPCEIAVGSRLIKAQGFVDTGNTAVHLGKPVCFVSPDLLYRLFDLQPAKERMTVRTVSGEKSIGLFQVDRISVIGKEEWGTLRGAYLSPAVHMLGRGYNLLLPRM